MERLIRIGFVLLVLSLTLNIALFSRVGRLTDDMNMLNSQWQNISTMAQQNADRINQAVTTIETEQRWITPVNIDSVKQMDNNAALKLSWVIKDYPAGAPVTFHYRKQGGTEFISQPAVPVGNGRFSVQLTEKMETEPEWKIGFSYIGEVDLKPSRISEEAKSIEGQNIMEYYITVKDGMRLKSSEISSVYMDKISWGLYGVITSDVEINGDAEQYSVVLTQHLSKPEKVKVARAFLEAYNGDKQLNQVKMAMDEANPDKSIMFNAQWKYNGQSFNRVFLRVEYENGKQFKKEITGSN